jgi:ABC-type transport system involved in cytochrome bd biosynthesis fused ATPase/permease subunit
MRAVEDRAALLVTHDLALASQADEIVLLVSGRIVARGSYEEISRDSTEFRVLADALMVQPS